MLSHANPLKRRMTGFTLIELMVGLAVGTMVLTGLLYAWSEFVRQNDYLLKVNRYNQDMRALTQIISQDLRRAVSVGNTSALELACLNSSNCDTSATFPSTGDCVVFDANIADTDDVDVAPPPTASGYRVINGNLQMWYSTANASSKGQCGAAETGGSWVTLVELEPNGFQSFVFRIEVVNSRCLELYVNNSESAGRCASGATEKVELLLANLFLQANAVIAGTTTRTFTLEDSVKIRNDAVFQ